MGFVDVVIVGAGISGINFARRLQESHPSLSFVILEGRNSIGGTWDFFKYPGIRSDSDLYTFGFSWYPWREDRAIADAMSIKRYLTEAINFANLDSHIQLLHKVVKADFSEESAQWELKIENDRHAKVSDEKVVHSAYKMRPTNCDLICEQSLRCRYTIFGTGYYDYEQAMPATIPGLGNFKKEIIHPQFWPEDLDYRNKNVVIIGSGATAVTLLPSLAKKAKHVTMLQRSPGYIACMDNTTPPILKMLMPDKLLYVFLRWWFLTSLFMHYQFCRAFPALAKRNLKETMEHKLPPSIPVDPHFSPRYNPWEQRLCLSPDGDFFDCLRAGTASISTGQIKGFTEKGICLQSGETIDDVDIVVTATGLRLVFAGKIEISVNGQNVDVSEKILWRGCMLEDVPNACFIMGYTNASWTLGADASAVLFCRLMSNMACSQQSSATPRFEGTAKERAAMKTSSFLNLNSTYVQKATDSLPKTGDTGPWKMRRNYYFDICTARWANLSDGILYRKKTLTEKKTL
jgi:cation diffusion facilitator CzcD-associated flavoprotein CzcO